MMKNIFDTADKKYSYNEFLSLIENLIAENKTTGNNQSEEYLHYTRLNFQRMKRWNKTASLPEDLKKDFENMQPQNWFVITEAWCGDSAQNLPLITKIAEASSVINLQIVLRDDNPEIMNAYLTDGSRSIPILAAFDTDNKFLFRWGPRPAAAQALMVAWKNATPQKSFEEFELEMHTWYTQNKGKDTLAEIRQLMHV